MKQSAQLSQEVDEFQRILSEAGVGDASALFKDYVNLLVEWNSRLNLVSRADISNLWLRHILHSLTPLLMFRIPANLEFVDIGSGGGLPGIPIAILRPDLKGVLVDSIRKKTNALSSIVQDLGLPNVRVVNERVEAAPFLKKFKSSFDLVFARAVAPLPDLVRWSLPLLKSSSGSTGEFPLPSIVIFKGGDIGTEVSQARQEFNNLSLTELPINIKGASEGLFADKKIVIVRQLT